MNNLERMKDVIARTTGVDEAEITEDSLFAGFCSDSLETVDLLLEIEIEFGIDIDDPGEVATVRQALALVGAK
jgi:acyl carrier protein